MPGGKYVPAGMAARESGIPERTLRRWLADGKVDFVEGGPRGRLVRLEDVTAFAAASGRRVAEDREPYASDGASRGEILTSREAAVMPAILRTLDSRYQGELAAKDALIDELRRRAERAEARLEAVNQQEPSSRPWRRLIFWRKEPG